MTADLVATQMFLCIGRIGIAKGLLRYLYVSFTIYDASGKMWLYSRANTQTEKVAWVTCNLFS